MQQMFYFNQEKQKFDDKPDKVDEKKEENSNEALEEVPKEPLFFKIVSGPEKKAIEKLKRLEEIEKVEQEKIK